MREAILILLCVICCRVESWTAIQDVRNVLDIAQTVRNMANQQQMIKAKQQMANRSMIPNQQRTRIVNRNGLAGLSPNRIVNVAPNSVTRFIKKQTTQQPKKIFSREFYIPSLVIKNNRIQTDGFSNIKFKVSYDGRFLAFSSKDILYIHSINGNLIKAIRSPGNIKELTFVGNNILYTHYDENGNVQAYIVYAGNQQLSLFTKSRKLFASGNIDDDFEEDPDSDDFDEEASEASSTNIRILDHNNQSCLLEKSSGGSYTLYKIDIRTGKATKLSSTDHKIICLFDSNLKIRLTIKPGQDEDHFDVFWKNIENGDLILIDQFSRYSNHRRYLSADNQGNIYFQTVSNGTLQIYKLNSVKSGLKSTKVQENLIYQITNVPDAAQCKVYINSQGIPYMLATHVKGAFNSSIADNKIKAMIATLNTKCASRKWSLESTSNDGKIWVIKVTSDTLPDLFLGCDSQSKKVWEIGKQVIKVAPNNIQEMKYSTCPNNPGVQIFFTPAIKRATNSTNGTPTIVIPDCKGKFRWGYSPLDQILAAHGYNVLHVNCQGTSSKHIQTNLWNAVCWAVNKNLCYKGNIALCASAKSAVHALATFAKHKSIFNCIAFVEQDPALISKLTTSIQNTTLLGNQSPTMLVAGHFSSMESENSWEEDFGEQSTIVSTNVPMTQRLIIGLLDNFFAKAFNNEDFLNNEFEDDSMSKKSSARIEPLTKRETAGLDVLHDGFGLLNAENDEEFDEENDADNDDEDLIYQDI